MKEAEEYDIDGEDEEYDADGEDEDENYWQKCGTCWGKEVRCC